MEKEIVYSDNAPKAVRPYSQAAIYNNIMYASGQVAFIPETGELVNDNIKNATRQTMENIKNLLNSRGLNMTNVIKTTVYLKNISDYIEMNEVYAEYFPERPPARTALAVACLPKDALVEIEIVAHM